MLGWFLFPIKAGANMQRNAPIAGVGVSRQLLSLLAGRVRLRPPACGQVGLVRDVVAVGSVLSGEVVRGCPYFCLVVGC